MRKSVVVLGALLDIIRLVGMRIKTSMSINTSHETLLNLEKQRSDKGRLWIRGRVCCGLVVGVFPSVSWCLKCCVVIAC